MRSAKPKIYIVLFLLGCVPAAFATTITFDSSTNLNYAGTAVPLAGGGVRLTDAIYQGSDATPPAGAIWLIDPVPVASGFSVSFAFQMSDGNGLADNDTNGPMGGDGLAFVIQNYSNQVVGRGAGGMGYMNIFNSVAVEFDTFQNLPWYGDPNGNHISVQTRGLEPNVPHHRCTNGKLTVPGEDYVDLPWVDCDEDPSLGSVVIDRPFNDGITQTATIEYVPGSLSVYLNDAFVLSVPLQLDTLLSLQNGTDAYIGFTAGTRLAYENHDILWAEYDTPDPEQAPEPSAWILVLSGLAVSGLLCYGKRENSSRMRKDNPSFATGNH
jgi:hypothetical protein